MKIMLDDGAYMPIRAHKTDAGLDLRTPIDITIPGYTITVNNGYITGADAGSATIDTGVHIEIPYGHYGKIESKSGLNVKHGIVACGGTIDEGYTGSIVVKLYNMTGEPYEFKAGDKIAQLILMPYLAPDIEIVNELGETDRGNQGFGSTGR